MIYRYSFIREWYRRVQWISWLVAELGQAVRDPITPQLVLAERFTSAISVRPRYHHRTIRSTQARHKHRQVKL